MSVSVDWGFGPNKTVPSSSTPPGCANNLAISSPTHVHSAVTIHCFPRQVPWNIHIKVHYLKIFPQYIIESYLKWKGTLSEISYLKWRRTRKRGECMLILDACCINGKLGKANSKDFYKIMLHIAYLFPWKQNNLWIATLLQEQLDFFWWQETLIHVQWYENMKLNC